MSKHEPEDTGIRAVRRKIQKDRYIAELIEKAESIRVSDKLGDELMKYFVTSRDMATGKFSYAGVSSSFTNPRKNMEKIAQVLLDTQAYRDRVVGIQLPLIEHSNTLAAVKRVAEGLIRERYSLTLKKRGSLSLQDSFIDTCLEPILEKRGHVDMYLARCVLILKNLDNAYFTYTGVKQIGSEVISRTEGGRHSNVRM